MRLIFLSALGGFGLFLLERVFRSLWEQRTKCEEAADGDGDGERKKRVQVNAEVLKKGGSDE